MISLLVVRHALAMDRAEFQNQFADVNDDAAVSDDSRPLTEEGIRKMRKTARGYKKIVGRPELLITSPLKRAAQTAEILTEVWHGIESETCPHLAPGSELSDFFDWLRNHSRWSEFEAKDVVITLVGHEPDLSRLINELIADRGEQKLQLRKGGACLIEISSDLEPGHGELVWFLPPRLVRKF